MSASSGGLASLRLPDADDQLSDGTADSPTTASSTRESSLGSAVKSAGNLWSSATSAIRSASFLRTITSDSFHQPALRRRHRAGSMLHQPVPPRALKSKVEVPFGDTVTCLSIDDDLISADGGMFAAGGINKWLRIYDLRSGSLLREIQADDSISCCQLVRLPPGKRAAVIGTFNGAIEIFDVDTGLSELRARFGQAEEVHTISSSRRTPRRSSRAIGAARWCARAR